MADNETEQQRVKEITDKLEEGLKELFESEKYKSYLSTMSKFHNYSFNNTLLIDTIRRTASELITGIEGQLQELQMNRAMEQAEEKESLLLVQTTDLSEYSLLNVIGMNAQELVEVLSEMNENDRLSVQAYLESKRLLLQVVISRLIHRKCKEKSEGDVDYEYNVYGRRK